MEKTEITAAFSYKINLGDFQNVDLFCSQKKECLIGEEEKTYNELYGFCRKQVIKEAVRFRTQVQHPIQMAEKSIVDNPMPTVEQWEAFSPQEKWLRLELNRGVKRVKYALRKEEKQNEESFADHLESIKNE